MSDPRTRITTTRAMIAPPSPISLPTWSGSEIGPGADELLAGEESAGASEDSPDRRSAVDAGPLIGKPHGNMRCVGVYLPRVAEERLRCAADSRSVTLGEALIDGIENLSSAAPTPRRDGRRPRRRSVAQPVTVFVLLSIDEARNVSALARQRNSSVSSLATDAILGRDFITADGEPI